MRSMTKFVKLIDAVNEVAGRVAGYVGLAVVLLVMSDVVMRYLFSTSFVLVQELEWHLFGVLFLLGAGYTLKADGHVRVDIFYQKMSPKKQAWVNLLGVLFFLIPGCIMVIDTSWGFFANSFAIGEGSPDPGGLPARYVLKFFIPLGLTLVLLQGFALGVRSLYTILGKDEIEVEAGKGVV